MRVEWNKDNDDGTLCSGSVQQLLVREKRQPVSDSWRSCLHTTVLPACQPLPIGNQVIRILFFLSGLSVLEPSNVFFIDSLGVGPLVIIVARRMEYFQNAKYTQRTALEHENKNKIGCERLECNVFLSFFSLRICCLLMMRMMMLVLLVLFLDCLHLM